ncbi:hypothetical protein NKG94_51905 [Micromonospora sp. M12]
MKAIRYHEFGSTEVLRQEEVERPVPGAGQVLVKVVATSFNPVDDHIRLGVLAEMIPTRCRSPRPRRRGHRCRARRPSQRTAGRRPDHRHVPAA